MILEHVNLTVTDPRATADLFERLFDWHTRWAGPSLLGGNTIHVGEDGSYVALYASDKGVSENPRRGRDDLVGLNHIGILVEDLDDIRQRVKAEGIEIFNDMAYDPGARFYFNTSDNIEVEVVSYAQPDSDAAA